MKHRLRRQERGPWRILLDVILVVIVLAGIAALGLGLGFAISLGLL